MDLALEHLLLRLRPVHRALRGAVDRRAAVSARTAATEVDRPCVTTEDAVALLDHLHQWMYEALEVLPPGALDEQELAFEQRLRDLSWEVPLPLDRLGEILDPLDIDLALATVAPELDGGYELVFGYIVDDLERRFPSIEALCATWAGDIRGQLAILERLGPAGALRRRGLVTVGPAGPTQRHLELRPGPELLPWLLGRPGDPSRLFADHGEVALPDPSALPPGIDPARLDALAAAVRDRRVDIVALWGEAGTARAEVAAALAARVGVPLRREHGSIRDTLRVAADLHGIAWIDCEGLDQPDHRDRARRLHEAIEAIDVPILLTGVTPHRPGPLLARRRYVEVTLSRPTWTERADWWSEALPTLPREEALALAARMALDRERLVAAAHIAQAEAAVTATPVQAHLGGAIAAATHGASSRFTSRIEPRRTAEDLVLPPEEHAAVLEVVEFHRASARVHDDWGMGRMLTGGAGIKALFTGDSGTGKTLAAEVIAGCLGMPLLRVDLAKVVSKWIGETEQNLEVAFTEAEACHAVLFFDEADGLFGKRGQVQKGTDRYANLEVNYLLQRLEDYSGVAILATNLRENIDRAFTRRFQVAVHFPRPGPAERRQIWRRAFPDTAPLADEIDLDLLCELDMTGAGIVASARTAALLAARRGSDRIWMDDLVQAVSRQFRREARVLPSRALGRWAEGPVA